jgi:archaemetzincin
MLGQLAVTFVVVIQPLGHVRQSVLNQAEEAVQTTFSAAVSVRKPMPLPTSAWYAPRRRWLAQSIVHMLPALPATRVLFVTEQDISVPAHGKQNWGVLGYTNTNAIFSTFRMHGDPKLLHDVTIHELGHSLGLPHCPNKTCVMQDLVGHAATIKNNQGFCPDCRKKLSDYLLRH